jgi:ABC-type nitrate/sulfonate/bicarbonate transport system substrate-binding protein
LQKFTEREHVTLTGIKNWFIAAFLFLMALPSAAYSQKLRVGTLYIGSTMLPLWIAREQGYFASRGFEVELIWLQSTLSTMALIAGEADLIYGTPQETLLAMAAKSAPPIIPLGPWKPTRNIGSSFHQISNPLKTWSGKA